MADKPFELSDLNGVNFSNDQLRYIEYFNTDPANGGVNGGSTVKIGGLVNGFLGQPSAPLNPGEMTVSSNFIAGHTEYSTDYYGNSREWYYLPTFGTVQFSDYIDDDGNPITLYVHGFTENGLLLSQNQNLVYADTGSLSGGSPATGSGEDPIALVLGVNGVGGGSFPVPESGIDISNVVFDKDPTIFCFAEGSRISTSNGLVSVEDLTIGDVALTVSGEARSVKWIGQLLARPSRHPRPHEVNPVCVRASAFGEGLPLRDLRLSPGHAVYVDGVLVPVGHLVNGATIVQEQVEQIRYFHVELDSHDVLLAEGLPCESYLDDGNRASAVNATEFTQLYGRLDPKSWDDACAPLVADGPQLAAIRQMLHARAEALGWTRCEEADLVIEADGVTILPESNDGTSLRFTVPAAASVVLRSNAGVLGQVMPELADRRLLGVAVSGLMVNGSAADLDDALFGAGFHQIERQDALAWRWSDGAGTLNLGGEAATIEVSLAMVAPSWKRAAAALRIAA